MYFLARFKGTTRYRGKRAIPHQNDDHGKKEKKGVEVVKRKAFGTAWAGRKLCTGNASTLGRANPKRLMKRRGIFGTSTKNGEDWKENSWRKRRERGKVSFSGEEIGR